MSVLQAAHRTGTAVTSEAISLCFSGRFPVGIDQWVYLPFDVPAGVGRITVDTAHDQFSVAGIARNVLDLGIFGAAGHEPGNAEGFRGWSGGARSGFTVSSTGATPGYRRGPVDPGRWALALGPVVLNPAGMGWQAQVTLQFGTSALQMTHSSPQRHHVSARGAGWYRGDLHLHTVHSDGKYWPAELADAARGAGLDFIASTDHNTNTANTAWETGCARDLVVLPGEEVTTRHGHWLAIGLPPDDWVDWRYAPRDRVFGRHADGVRQAGGMVVAAHPAVPLPGSAWEFGFGGVDAIEVWNGTWNLDDEVSLRIWHRLLRRGWHIAAVGGSDSHGPHQPVGLLHTVVHAATSTAADLIEGLRRGRSYLAESAAVTVDLRASSSIDGRTLEAGPGETLVCTPGEPVEVEATAHGAPSTDMVVVTARGRAAHTRVDGSGVGRLRWTTQAGASGRSDFVRVEVRRCPRGRLRSMLALTNPVWLSSDVADTVGELRLPGLIWMNQTTRNRTTDSPSPTNGRFWPGSALHSR